MTALRRYLIYVSFIRNLRSLTGVHSVPDCSIHAMSMVISMPKKSKILEWTSMVHGYSIDTWISISVAECRTVAIEIAPL